MSGEGAETGFIETPLDEEEDRYRFPTLGGKNPEHNL
jgi:hypothetical protein